MVNISPPSRGATTSYLPNTGGFWLTVPFEDELVRSCRSEMPGHPLTLPYTTHALPQSTQYPFTKSRCDRQELLGCWYMYAA